VIYKEHSVSKHLTDAPVNEHKKETPINTETKQSEETKTIKQSYNMISSEVVKNKGFVDF